MSERQSPENDAGLSAETVHERIERARCRNTYACGENPRVTRHRVDCPGYVEHLSTRPEQTSVIPPGEGQS